MKMCHNRPLLIGVQLWTEIADHTSERERRAVDAERDTECTEKSTVHG